MFRFECGGEKAAFEVSKGIRHLQAGRPIRENGDRPGIIAEEDRIVTSFQQFSSKAKMRHDFSDQIQVRYSHPNGEDYDTWISGEEVMRRLNSRSRERLIKSFSKKQWRQMREEAADLINEGKKKARKRLKDKVADEVSDALGDNIFADSLADNIRGITSDVDPHDQEKLMWQQRLQDEAFRMVALGLAWINLEGTFPHENQEEPDDWV